MTKPNRISLPAQLLAAIGYAATIGTTARRPRKSYQCAVTLAPKNGKIQLTAGNPTFFVTALGGEILRGGDFQPFSITVTPVLLEMLLKKDATHVKIEWQHSDDIYADCRVFSTSAECGKYCYVLGSPWTFADISQRANPQNFPDKIVCESTPALNFDILSCMASVQKILASDAPHGGRANTFIFELGFGPKSPIRVRFVSPWPIFAIAAPMRTVPDDLLGSTDFGAE